MTSTADNLRAEAGKCINCGFCEAVCPTLPSSGYDSSKGARGRVMLGKELLSMLSLGEDISALSDPFFSCLDCYACAQVCPAGVNAGKVSHLAREILVEKGRGVPDLARLVERSIMRYNSVLPLGRRAGRWAEGLSIPDSGDTLLYTGQMYQLMSYSSALNEFLGRRGDSSRRFIAGLALRLPWLMHGALLLNRRAMAREMDGHLRNIAALLRSAGVNFFYLGGDEPYPGTLLHDMGFSSSMREYAVRVAGIFRSRGVRRVVTVDPHTHDMLCNVYPSIVDGFDIEVVHYTELLGDLEFGNRGEKLAFHEPCHLARRFDDMSAPLALARKAADISLPASCGRGTHCCGGPDELLYPEIGRGVTAARTGQLDETGAGTTLTACPVCLVNLGRNGRVVDISDLLASSLGE